MLKLKKIAITGSLSSGKTTVCKIFKELGAYVISADEIVHQLLTPGTTIAEQVVDLLGSDVGLDRKKIADRVFSEPHLLAALEALLHPVVFEEIDKKYAQVSTEGKHTLFVAEVPLLAGKENRFDYIIALQADPEQCRTRFMQKTNYSAEEFNRRMHRQMALEQQAIRAHYTINNKGTLQQLRADVESLYSQLTS